MTIITKNSNLLEGLLVVFFYHRFIVLLESGLLTHHYVVVQFHVFHFLEVIVELDEVHGEVFIAIILAVFELKHVKGENVGDFFSLREDLGLLFDVE